MVANKTPLDLEPIRLRLARNYGGDDFWADELRDIRVLLDEIDRLRLRLADRPIEESVHGR